jgi:hypothetical protein
MYLGNTRYTLFRYPRLDYARFYFAVMRSFNALSGPPLKLSDLKKFLRTHCTFICPIGGGGGGVCGLRTNCQTLFKPKSSPSRVLKISGGFQEGNARLKQQLPLYMKLLRNITIDCCHLLGYSAVQSVCKPTFRRNVSTPSSGSA